MRIARMAVLCVSVVACGAAALPPPTTQFDQAQADIARAEGGGAQGVPDAKLHLQLATEDLQKSKSLSGQDNRRAQSLLDLATVEAHLAFSLAKAAQAQAGTQQAQQEVQKAKSGGTP
jgi:hypothetical protein